MVVSIIGILSSVVLSSVNTARDKGYDATVKSDLVNARTQAELFLSANSGVYMVTSGSATDVCASSGLVSGTRGIYTQVLAAAKA
jgi:Tfp pilus assembly protein PilE